MVTGDPYKDFDRWDGERERWRRRRPRCKWCGEHIQSEHLYIVDGLFICDECIDEFDGEDVTDIDVRDTENFID